MTTQEEYVDQWLQEKPYALWGEYDIGNEDRRKLAVEWFVKEVGDFMRWRGERQKKDHQKAVEAMLRT